MHLQMLVNGELWFDFEFDFTGKGNHIERQQYVETLAASMAMEFEFDIAAASILAEHKPVVEFCYTMPSRLDFETITEFDMHEFEIKLNAARINRKLNFEPRTQGPGSGKI